MSKDRKVKRLNEVLLDSTGFNSINNLADLREFIFRLILLFPTVDFTSNFKQFYLFLFCDKDGNTYKYYVTDLLKLKNEISYRNEITHESFLEEIDSYRSISFSAQMFGGIAILKHNGQMIFLESTNIDVNVIELTDAYDMAAEIISHGTSLMGETFSFET